VTLDARTKLLFVLAAVFVTALVVGNIIGGKLYQTEAGGLALTISVGMVPFPVVFLLTDLINEFYGQRTARFVTWVGFAMAWFTIAIIQVADQVPFAPFTAGAAWTGVNADAFDRVFVSSTKILVASTAAYLVGQLVDIGVFHFLRRRTSGKALWLRATGSTVISQLIDTVLINFLVWWVLAEAGQEMSGRTLVSIMVTSYVVKAVVALAMTPLIYGAHELVERGLGIRPVAVD
jgi:queuosine precursor transporter